MENTNSLICKRISEAMCEIDAISKDRQNAQQNYKFRGIDDVYNELHALLAKHKIFTLPTVLEDKHEERQSRSGGNNIYRILKIKYTFYTDDGSSLESIVIGEGMDSGDKASNKAMSVAHKYVLLQAFCIPTDDSKDPENESHEPTTPIKNQPQGSDHLHPQLQPSTAQTDLISDAQRKRMYAIGKGAGKSDDDMKLILSMFNYSSSKDVCKSNYEAVCEKMKNQLSQNGQSTEEPLPF